MTAFKSPAQFASEPSLTPPDPVTTENFARLFGGDYGFVSPIAVTAQVVAVILVGQLAFSIMAAYAFAKLRFAYRDTLFWVYLATLMIPQVVIVIPLYAMMVQSGMRNTFWALVLPFMFGSPYAVFLLREHFRGIPDDLIDAARIDGAGDWRILWQIVVPLSRGDHLDAGDHHRGQPLEQLHVAADHHHRTRLADDHRCHSESAESVQRQLDAGDGGHHGGDGAAADPVRGVPANHRELHLTDRLQVIRSVANDVIDTPNQGEDL